jgi:hypothetical protein
MAHISISMSRSFIKIYLFGLDFLFLIVPGIFSTLPGGVGFLFLFFFWGWGFPVSLGFLLMSVVCPKKSSVL